MTSPHPRPILRVIALAILACLFAAPAAVAQNKRKIAASKGQIQELVNEAERLMEIGRVNEAEKLLVKAKKLKQSLAKTGKRREHGSDDYHGLFVNLKKAIGALKELGRREHAQKLAQFTEQLYADLQRRRPEGERERKRKRERERERERDSGERAEAKRQLQILRYAKAAFDEAEKEDALEMIERVMHARELQLEGRRDREARQIIKKAPGKEDVAELLGWASKILMEYGAEEKAGAVKGLADQMAGRWRERGRRERGRQEGERSEREVARHQVEVLKFSSGVLDKAERGEAAELMAHAAKALALRLEGVRTDEAEKYMKAAPNREQVAKMLGLTVEILQDRGQRDRAEMVAKVARQFAPRRRGRGQERERERKREKEVVSRREGRPTDTEERLEKLAERLERMARTLEELQEQIQRLKRQTR